MDLRFWKRHRMIPKLPTGPYAVGCTDVMTATGTAGLFFRLFYPTVSTEGAELLNWLPDKNYLKGFARFHKIWPPAFAFFYPVFVGELNIPAFWNAPPLAIDTKFPVVVFSHGLGGCRTTHSIICSELASNGYVVAAVEHRDCSAGASFFLEDTTGETAGKDKPLDDELRNSDKRHNSGKNQEPKKKYIFLKKVKPNAQEYAIRNKQVHIRSEDCIRVLDWLQSLNDGDQVTNVLQTSFPLNSLKGLLDFNRAAVGGHSFGGITAILTLAEDPRFKVGFCLDPWMFPLKEEVLLLSAVKQHVIFVNTETFHTVADKLKIKEIASVCPRLEVSTVRGTVHANQADGAFILNPFLKLLFGARSRLDCDIAMDLTTRLTMVFLAKHLDLPRNGDHENYIRTHQEIIREDTF